MNKLFLFLFLFTTSSYAELSCIPDEVGCTTRLGSLFSKEKSDQIFELYLNEKEVLKINSNSIDEASVYNGLPNERDKNKKLVKTILRYISDECIIENQKTNCPRYMIADFSGKEPVFSPSFTPPVIDSFLMKVNWSKGNVYFNDNSVFFYKNGVIKMISGGVIARQEEIEKAKN